jgi:hypothetical protein
MRDLTIVVSETSNEKTLLLLTALASLTIVNTVFANLGDTREQSNQRYGPPTQITGPCQRYELEKCIIIEVFDANGIAQGIDYMKKDGTPFDKWGIDLIDHANIDAATLKKNQWTNLNWKPSEGFNAVSYVTYDPYYQWTSGCLRMDDGKWIYTLSIYTTVGNQLVMEYQRRVAAEHP